MNLLLLVSTKEVHTLMRSCLYRKQCINDAIKSNKLTLTGHQYDTLMSELDVLDRLIDDVLSQPIKEPKRK